MGDLIKSLLGIIPSLNAWFETLSRPRRERDERVRGAVRALYVALCETQIYIGFLERPPYARVAPPSRLAQKAKRPLKRAPGSRKGVPVIDPFSGGGNFVTHRPRRRAKEEALARLWTEAAVLLHEVNPELAHLCALKAGYWASPESWEPDEVLAAQIGIHQMRTAASKMLTRT
jgi:hypothetical protein